MTQTVQELRARKWLIELFINVLRADTDPRAPAAVDKLEAQLARVKARLAEATSEKDDAPAAEMATATGDDGQVVVKLKALSLGGRAE